MATQERVFEARAKDAAIKRAEEERAAELRQVLHYFCIYLLLSRYRCFLSLDGNIHFILEGLRHLNPCISRVAVIRKINGDSRKITGDRARAAAESLLQKG